MVTPLIHFSLAKQAAAPPVVAAAPPAVVAAAPQVDAAAVAPKSDSSVAAPEAADSAAAGTRRVPFIIPAKNASLLSPATWKALEDLIKSLKVRANELIAKYVSLIHAAFKNLQS